MSRFLQAVYPQVREVIDFSPDYKQYLQVISSYRFANCPFVIIVRRAIFLSRETSRQEISHKGCLEIACAQESGLRVQGERALHRGRVTAQPVSSLPFHEVSSGQHETRRYCR